MDWEARLPEYPKDKLQQLARNAASIVATNPESPKGREAENLLRLIDAERARRSLPGNIDSFLEKFPLGFSDPLYRKEERDDKIEASAFCRSTLSKEALEIGAKEDPAALIHQVKRLVSMTNLIQGSFEKPKLLDAIQDPRISADFLIELSKLLHGTCDSPDRLEEFADFLHTLGLRKWTYVTYFLFMSNPQSDMFVKPEGLKKAVEIAEYPLDYESAPSARVYRQVLEFAEWINAHLRQSGHPHLAPEDMVDTQSFIWRMAPTGKFAR